MKSIASESRQLVNDILDNKLTHEQIVQKMIEMEAKYPNCGWHEEMIKLKAHWKRMESVPPFEFKNTVTK